MLHELHEVFEVFERLGPLNGKITGVQAGKVLQDSGLDFATIRRIWTLSDLDNDGSFDLREFAICKTLIKMKINLQDLPVEIPQVWLSPNAE